MKYELNGFTWYIGYNKSENFWYANGEERNFVNGKKCVPCIIEESCI